MASYGDGLLLEGHESLYVLTVHLVFCLLQIFKREVDSIIFCGQVQNQESIDLLEPGGLWFAALDDLIDSGAGGGAAGALEAFDNLLRTR